MTRKLAIYALLMVPTAFLTGLLALTAAGVWISAILEQPSRFDDAPLIVQKMTRSVYFNTRTHWQTKKQCVEFDADTLYRPRPGLCYFSNAEFSTTMHFDDLGRRRTASPMADTVNKPRVVVVGDSHAMGWGVEDHETFASQLAMAYGYSVFNLGVSSYGTVRELRHLVQRYKLKPDDVVIIQYCDNDLEENEYYLTHGRVGPYEPVQLANLVGYRPTPATPLPIAGLVLRGFLHTLVTKIRSLVKRVSGSKDKGVTDDHAARTLESVIRSFPIIGNHRVVIVAINGPDNATHLEAGRQLLESAGLALVVPSLSRRLFFRFEDHMTPSGHEAVADAIARAIEETKTVATTSDLAN